MTPSPAPAAPAPADPAARTDGFRGNDRLLLGLVLAVITFWLFAGTVGTVAPAMLENIGTNNINKASMNLAVSITALCSGLFIVLFGGFADRFGRVKMARIGIILGIIGSTLLIFASGSLALPLLLVGRAIQGLSAACIMPSTMALVKTYWDGPARQRAVSMWSIGSWGGSGLAAVFGGGMVRYAGWRGIFVASIVVSILAFALLAGTPESKVEQSGEPKRFDLAGLLLFIIGTLGLMITLLFGSKLGWGSPPVLVLTLTAIVAYALFVRLERHTDHPFIDFSLFRNTTFTGAAISNFLLNGTIGMLIVTQQLIQLAGHKSDGSLYTAWDAGLLTLGYALFIIAFIRVGEKMLQRFGPRKPMIWGSLIVIAATILLMGTNVRIGQYVIMSVIAYALFGLGLAFYATPSTDAALSNLPANQAGSGAGIYKMASSLGSAIGAAVSLAVFTALAGSKGSVLGSVVQMEGRLDNVALRQAGMIAVGVSLVFLLLAIIAITVTVPRGGGSRDVGKVAASPAPAPQLPPDEERAAVLARLSAMPTEKLLRLEKSALLEELETLDTKVLEKLVRERRT